MTSDKPSYRSVSAVRNADTGKIEYEPKFEGGTYFDWKGWYTLAMNARDALRKEEGEIAPNVVDLDASQLPATKKPPSSLDADVAAPHELSGAERLWLEHEERVYSLEWERDGPYSDADSTEVVKLGSSYFILANESGMGDFGPFPTLLAAIGWRDGNLITEVTTSVHCSEMTASTLAMVLAVFDTVPENMPVKLNGEQWKVDGAGRLQPNHET